MKTVALQSVQNAFYILSSTFPCLKGVGKKIVSLIP